MEAHSMSIPSGMIFCGSQRLLMGTALMACSGKTPDKYLELWRENHDAVSTEAWFNELYFALREELPRMAQRALSLDLKNRKPEQNNQLEQLKNDARLVCVVVSIYIEWTRYLHRTKRLPDVSIDKIVTSDEIGRHMDYYTQITNKFRIKFE